MSSEDVSGQSALGNVETAAGSAITRADSFGWGASNGPPKPPDGRQSSVRSTIGRSRRAAGPALLVGLLTVLVFLPAVDNGFVNWDDDVNLTENPHFRGLSPAHLRWMFTTTLMGHYIPLTWLSFGVDHAVWGMDPRGYHLTSVLLHALNAALVFLVARRLLGGESVTAPAAIAALVFALHPLRAESVAWVTQRRDVLSGAFVLLALLAYLKASDIDVRRSRWLAVSLAAFAAALLSKAITMTFPLVLLVLDVYAPRRLERRTLIEKLPFAGLAGAGAAIALLALRSTAVTSWTDHGPESRLAMVAFSLGFYASRTLLPIGLSPLYELPGRIDLLAPVFALSMLGVLAMTAAALVLRRCAPWLLAAWLAYLVMVLPVSGPVHSGHQLAHDRYSYLACLPWALLAGAAIGWVVAAARRGVVRPLARTAAITAVVALLGAWTLLTLLQIRVWSDSETLWRTAVDIDPRCSVCRTNLGRALLARGQLDAAGVEFRQAIAARPERANPHNNLGAVLYRQGRIPEALEEFRLAAELEPHFPDPLNNLGVVYASLGRDEEAARQFRAALAIRPNFPEARTNLERALARARP